MRDIEFSDQFNLAVRRIRRGNGEGIAEEQARLRELVPQLTTEAERQWAAEMIAKLPRRAVPSPPSPLMAEALRIQDSAFFAGGTTEERLARLTAAREQILELADRAPSNEGPHIAALTRMLEHREEALRNPPFELQDPPPGRSS